MGLSLNKSNGLHCSKIALIIGAGMFLNGCSGVFQPYVHTDAAKFSNDPSSCAAPKLDIGVVEEIVDRARSPETAAIDGDLVKQEVEQAARTQGECDLSVDIDHAILYAEAQKSAYLDALKNQGAIGPALGTTLIPLGATALGIVTLGSSNTMSGILGLTGAGILGVGNWLENDAAQGAYISGYEAVNCAIDAVVPFKSVQPDVDNPAFDRALLDLQSALPRLKRAIDRAVQIQEPEPGLAEKIANGRQAVTDGDTTFANAIAAQLAVDEAGYRLVTTVDRIAAEVDRGVLNNQVQVENLASLIGGLGGVFGSFSPLDLNNPSGAQDTVVEDAGPAAAFQPLGQPLSPSQAAMAEISEAMDAVYQAVLILAPAVNKVAARNPQTSLAACKIDPTSFSFALSVAPPGPFELAKDGGEQSVELKGGKPPYSFQRSPADNGLNVVQDDFFGAKFKINTTAESKPGASYAIAFKDGAGNAQEIKVTIKNGPAPANQ